VASTSDEPRIRVGTFHHVILQSKYQLITAGMVHVTNLTPGSECNPTEDEDGASVLGPTELNLLDAEERLARRGLQLHRTSV
jgi:hypothetical protein